MRRSIPNAPPGPEVCARKKNCPAELLGSTISRRGTSPFRTKSPEPLIAEAAAPERQMKRTLSLIAASAVTIFHRKSASRAVHDGIHRVQNRW